MTTAIHEPTRLDRGEYPTQHSCRFCGEPLHHVVVDLGMSPLANSLLTQEELSQPEIHYPLEPRVCGRCFLVQLPEVATPEHIFSEYPYFSSYSDSWLRHAEAYVRHVATHRGIGPEKRVLEIASNDGYLLRYFRARGNRVLGIEPAGNVAAAAEAEGIPTLVAFFGLKLAEALRGRSGTFDLVVANNVLAHVPALNDFVAGVRTVLASDGLVTMEFPHLQRLIEHTQFDTIYHEHLSYFSLATVVEIFESHELTIVDVDELSTHGGSLRIYATHATAQTRPKTENVHRVLDQERRAGLRELGTYAEFAQRVRQRKHDLLGFLVSAKAEGACIAAYGAAAKGITLLCYCGIRSDLVDYVVDRSPHKQGMFLPGVRLPILAPEALLRRQPRYLLILAWNLKDEIVEQMAHLRELRCRFVVPIPELHVLD
jgi:2-polyprenyl-3-methyl-5-hydroxy-6-metoxy-1,4-benzoquinol methylase